MPWDSECRYKIKGQVSSPALPATCLPCSASQAAVPSLARRAPSPAAPACCWGPAAAARRLEGLLRGVLTVAGRLKVRIVVGLLLPAGPARQGARQACARQAPLIMAARVYRSIDKGRRSAQLELWTQGSRWRPRQPGLLVY